MNNIPYGFQSPVLAQKKLLEIFNTKEQHGENCDIIEKNPRIDTMTNISTVPSLNKNLPASDRINPELKGIISRASKRAYEKYLNSESGLQTLAKAARYNIPFDSNDIDFLDLMDKITDYEYLLERAVELAVDWDESNYDIAALQGEIEAADGDPERLTINDSYEHRRDYYVSIALYNIIL